MNTNMKCEILRWLQSEADCNSTLHLDSCSQKQEFDERYLGCGFPALVIIPIFAN